MVCQPLACWYALRLHDRKLQVMLAFHIFPWFRGTQKVFYHSLPKKALYTKIWNPKNNIKCSKPNNHKHQKGSSQKKQALTPPKHNLSPEKAETSKDTIHPKQKHIKPKKGKKKHESKQNSFAPNKAKNFVYTNTVKTPKQA